MYDYQPSRGQSEGATAACWSLGWYLKEKHTCTRTRKHAHSLTHDQEELPHLYPRLWQQSLPQDREQFNFKHHLSLGPALFSGLLSVSLAACLLQLAIVCSVAPLRSCKRNQDQKLKQEERRKVRVACGGKPQRFLIDSGKRGGAKLPFPSADFRLVRPAPAITYILTPILTTDSTPNYHVPSMTILQAHPHVHRSCYLKTRQRPTTTTSAAVGTL